ncbi:BTB/POZ protein [Rhizophagus clarus]|nr:BTB/POZ protein [Rhizophagus clarus]
MVILNYRSPYLQRILSTNKKKNDGTLAHIKLPNISPEIFQIILRYIYGGKISLEECDASVIFKTLDAANKLSLQELVSYSQSFLIENKKNWINENFNSVYQTSFENNSFLELQKYCTDLVSEEPDKIFKSPSFSLIPENLLISLIQNDHLLMNEVQIWEHVIDWGIAQNPELPSDFANYSKNDFKTLKNTLQHCIPFVRFYNLSSKEFMEKVLPRKKLLPKDLYDDLLKTFLSLSNPGSIPENKSKPRTARNGLKIKPEENYRTYIGEPSYPRGNVRGNVINRNNSRGGRRSRREQQKFDIEGNNAKLFPAEFNVPVVPGWLSNSPNLSQQLPQTNSREHIRDDFTSQTRQPEPWW